MVVRLNLLLLLVFLVCLATAQEKTAVKAHPASKPAVNLPSEETVNGFLEQMFGYDSSLSWKILSIKPSEAEGLAEVDVLLQGPQGPQGQKFYVTPDGRHALVGDVFPFGVHPFEADRKVLDREAHGPSRGPASAPVTIVEFSDLQCPHCKEEQPTLDKLIEDDKNMRLVFENFPLPAHDWAAKAASYAECIGRTSNDAFWKFVESVYASQSEITSANADDKLKALADEAGAKGADVAICAEKPETTSRVQQSIELGKSLDVNSTPTIFINGRKISPGGLPIEVLQKLVDFAAKQQK